MYGAFNIYTSEMDLAVIKPRWTTKHEFKVDLPQNQSLEDNPEEGLTDLRKIPSLVSNHDKMLFSMRFRNDVLEDWERDELPKLKEELE